MTWRELALCAQTDPEVFFPEPGRADTLAAARRICAQCEVSAECLAEAVADARLVGIWAGSTVLERQSMRAVRRRLEVAA